MVASNIPSVAKNESDIATLLAAESVTSPPKDCSPEFWPIIITCPKTTLLSDLIRSAVLAFILWGIADDPAWPALNPSVKISAAAIILQVSAKLEGPQTS